MQQRRSIFRGEDFSDDLDLRPLLEDLGIEIAGETDTHYQVFCIYHQNYHTTAATIAKENGFLFCFSAECEKKASIEQIVQDVKHTNYFETRRYILKYVREKSLDQKLENIVASKEELKEFPTNILKAFQENYSNSEEAQYYIDSRKIKQKTALDFGIGFDKKKKMIVTPMWSNDEILVGLIGRSIQEKRFKNSSDLPSSKTLFNIHRAKKANSENVIVVESNFDCIRAHQAGFPNTVATLSGAFSEYHLSQLNRYFSTVILAVDNDDSGKKLAGKIAKKCRDSGLSVWQAKYSESELFPHSAKDFGDCSDDEIAHMIRNSDIY